MSRPYLEMTAQAMRDFGARVTRQGERTFVIERSTYEGRTYAVEPDASAASYFFAAAAITGGRVRVEGLGTRSLQGDRRLVHILAQMGCCAARGRGLHRAVGARARTAGRRRRRHGRAVRRRADAGRGRAVRAHADACHRHRLHSQKGDRSGGRRGQRAQQARHRARSRRPTASWCHPARPRPARSTPTTTTAWR